MLIKKCDKSKTRIDAKRINIASSSGHSLESNKKLQRTVNKYPKDEIKINIAVSITTKNPMVNVFLIPNR